MSRGTLGGMIPRIDPETIAYALLLVILVIGGTLRLTRLVTTDSLGGWLLRDPAQKWADGAELARRSAIIEVAGQMQEQPLTPVAEIMMNRELRRLDSDDPITWQARLVSGLYCPFCIGFWIGALVAIATAVLALLPVVSGVWVAVLALLTLNYITGHISARID